jgi:hypothetical protein
VDLLRFAEAGSTVLAVNGDFRRPALHKQFGVADVPGAILDAGIRGVQIVTSVDVSASATPAQIVTAQRQLIQTTRRHYDIVILDTAPLLSTNDTVDIAPLADLVLVVAQYGLTKSHHVRRTAEVLQRLRAPVGGVVFVATPPRGDDAGYSYYYGPTAPGAGVAPIETRAEPVGGAAATPLNGAAVPGAVPGAVLYRPPRAGTGTSPGTNGHAVTRNGVAGNGSGRAPDAEGGPTPDPDEAELVSWRPPLQWKPGA